jgi:hypothetical protein
MRDFLLAQNERRGVTYDGVRPLSGLAGGVTPGIGLAPAITMTDGLAMPAAPNLSTAIRGGCVRTRQGMRDDV